jgi:hypothetical protein
MSYGAFLAKLDASGAHLWSKGFGDGDDDVGKVVVDGSGNVVITGDARDPMNFGGGLLVPAGSDAYVAKFDGAGAHLWSKLFGGTDNDHGYSVAVDAAGDVYATGRFYGTVDFGSGPIVVTADEAFVLKLSASGNHVWDKAFTTGVSDITVDAVGNLLLGGYFNGTVDLGGGPLSAPNGASLAAKLDGAGAHLWSKAYPNGGVLAVAGDGATNPYLLGNFYGAIDFGGGVLTSAAGGDFYLVKLQP